MTEITYTPEIGHAVRVRRYDVPTPELPGLAERKLLLEVEGIIATVRELAGGVLITLEGDLGCPIFAGYQFTGQDPEHGCSWSLATEVVPLADVAAHDQAELDARVAQAEREKAAVLAQWERARDAEVTARQRLTAAQERLEAAMGKAARHRADLDAGADLSETRKADRAAMAQLVLALAGGWPGITAQVQPEQGGSRRTAVDLAGPHGLRVTVQFRGNTPQCEPDTYVLSWHMLPRQDEGYRLNPAAFAYSVNPVHGCKATDIANGWPELRAMLERRFRSIADGSAFIRAS